MVLSSKFSVGLAGSLRPVAVVVAVAVSLAHFHLPDSTRLVSSRLGSTRLGAINRRSTGALIAINLH